MYFPTCFASSNYDPASDYWYYLNAGTNLRTLAPDTISGGAGTWTADVQLASLGGVASIICYQITNSPTQSGYQFIGGFHQCGNLCNRILIFFDVERF